MVCKARSIAGLSIIVLLAACNNASDQPAPSAAPPAAPAAAAAPSPIPGYEVVQVADGGSISGTVSVTGAVPKLAKRDIKKDPQVCGKTARDSEQLLVSPTGGLKNAIVIVEGVKRGKAVPATLQAVQIDQKNCEYTPHVSVVPLSTDISIKNSDPLLHNIHFYQNDESLFNIAQPSQGQVNNHKLEKSGMVYAECDVHSWMQGHVAVVDNPYFAITDESGKFTIPDLPPGTYKVKVWHEYLGEKAQDMSVTGKSDTTLNLDLKDLLAAKATSGTPPAAPAGNAAPADSKAGAADKKAEAGGSQVVVKMISDGSSFRFEPADITIKVGTTVRWVNESENRHTATDDPNFEKNPGQAVLPQGSEPWGSPFMPTNDTFNRKFTVPGKYKYFCRNHGQFGMEATITVVP
jgi:plastocyanin